MKKNISSMTIALLLFVAVFGITNIPTNYANLGNSSIVLFALLGFYFVPLALIIGELSSHDVDSKSGMFGWIKLGLGEKWAFIGAWSYFIVNIFYLPMLASRIPVLTSWVVSAKFDTLNQVVEKSGEIPGVITASQNHFLFLTLSFAVCILAIILGMFFEKFFSSFAKYIGWISLLITGFFIVGALIAIPISGGAIVNPITFTNIMPPLNTATLSNFAWIVFAIAGIETVGSYTPHLENAQKKIPKAIALGATLTIVAYLIGLISLSFILTPEQVPIDHMENMIPIMFAKVGSYYGLSTIYLRIVAFIFLLITITALVLWLNATVISLFEDFPTGIINEKYIKKTIAGKPLLGYIITILMVGIFLLISNGSTSSNIYYTLYDMTTIAVLLPYVLISLSYIAFCKSKSPGNIIKNKKVGLTFAFVILIVTLIAIFFSIFDFTLPNIEQFIDWALLTGGGLLFFICIGISVYVYKSNKLLAYFLSLTLSLLATLFLSMYFVILITIILIAIAYEYIINK